MNKIQLTARFKIHAGKPEEAKKIAAECLAIVKEKEEDKGALQYDWFLSSDQTECVVRETYVDSNAVLIHMGNLGEPLDKILAIADFDLGIYGNMSEELKNAVVGLNPKVYSFYQGL